MHFNEKLRKLRKTKELSQSMLSKLTKIPQTTISDWETNKTSPDLKQLKMLCDVLEVSIIQLLDDVT
ncbi:hypothetical protein SH1V18_15320 [Vallitalea longa]|uniref:HTH cro/C1-type domain-containing protein n=1 Tax=Vallitalea longa TaxID=2936439 RepID=A0A9W5Y8Y3_9FIRM|nr:helix-turn-helix transcriptional regulator [Vallitalea longa]GKX29052.1 hypothetical protein SH1V18_15320 [Vallitalea longa]